MCLDAYQLTHSRTKTGKRLQWSLHLEKVQNPWKVHNKNIHNKNNLSGIVIARLSVCGDKWEHIKMV